MNNETVQAEYKDYVKLVDVSESLYNQRGCYLSSLIRLHEECLKLDFSAIPQELMEAINYVNDVLNADMETLPLEKE